MKDFDFGDAEEKKHHSSINKRAATILRDPDAANLIIGVVIGIAVCAPFFNNGRLLLLDWSIGPHDLVATPTALGLNGGLTTGIGGAFVVALLNRVLGSASTWLPMLAFFPIATVAAGRLAGRSRWSRVAAGTLYAVNPFVFNRLFVGHLALLIGYALLPFAVNAAIRSVSSQIVRWLAPPLWWAGLTSLSPHFAWIYGLVIIGVVSVALMAKQHPFRRVGGWLVTCVGAFTLMNAYIFLPYFSTNLPSQIGSVSLDLYRTNGDAHLGLFANVAALYGFWRTGPGPELPKDVIRGWPFIMFAILVIIVAGFSYAIRKVPDSMDSTDENRSLLGEQTTFNERRLAFLLLFVGLAGYFLALGDQGPTGGLFLWAYDHVPFFSIMREPQKFLMLLALAYAVFFGWGVDRLSRIQGSLSRVSAIAAAALFSLILPLGYCATIFDGLTGQLSTSSLPPAYQRADALMGNGAGDVLALPWHLYLKYPFTDGRVISNIAPSSFRRNVISGDNVQSGDVETQSTSPRSAYIEQLLENGDDTMEFGELVRPLGVEYVVLSKAVDWKLYNWLNHQNDLELILDDRSLELWRNLAYKGVGQRVTTLKSVSSIAGLLTLAKSNEIGAGAIVARESNSNSSVSSNPVGKSSTSAGESFQSHSVHELSPVAYKISSGRPGWVTVDATYERGWSLDGRAATKTAEGTVLVRVGSKGGVLEFTPWRMVRLGYIVSVGVFTSLTLVLVIEPRRRKRAMIGPVDFGCPPGVD